MSLDLSRLENVRQRGEKTIARCPACAEQDHDEKGEHLIIQPDGRFGCVACPGIAGKCHRQRIYTLAGDSKFQQRLGCRVRVHRPDHVRLPRIAATVVDLTQLGTLGTGFSNPYVMREKVCVCENGKYTHTQETYTLRSGEKASQPSQPIPQQRRQAPLPECHDPLMATALTVFGDPRQADTAAQDTDPETGHPIIGGAICPF